MAESRLIRAFGWTHWLSPTLFRALTHQATQHAFPIFIGECRRYTIDLVKLPDCQDGPSNSLLMLAV